MTGLPVTRIAREIDPLVRRSAELGLPQRARAGHRRHHRGRARRRGARTPRRRRALQRVVGLGAHRSSTDGRAVNHQWSKGEEFERGFGELVARRAGARPVRCSPTSGRAPSCGCRERFARLTRYHRAFRSCNRAFHQDPARAPRPLVRPVRQVLLRRPRPRALHGPRRPRPPCSPGDEPLENPANEERFRTLLGLGAGAKPFECVGDTDECRAAVLLAAEREDRAEQRGPRTGCGPNWSPRRQQSPRPRTRRRCSRRRVPTASRIAMRQPISWSALADASVGVWGLGVEGTASIRRLRCHGPHAGPGRRRAGRAGPRRARGPGHGLGGPGRAAPLRRRRQEPGHQPLPARGGAARGGRRAPSAAVSACSWRRPIRPASPASPARRARARRRRWPCTCSTRLGYRARAGGNIGQPPWDPAAEPAPDYWIVETSSFQVPDLCHGPRVVAVTSLVPGPSRLARDGRALLRRQALAVHEARRRRWPWPTARTTLLRAQAALLGPHLRWVTAPTSNGTRPGRRHSDCRAAQRDGTPPSPGPCSTASASPARRTATGWPRRPRGFGGLPSRCRSLGRVGGVEFVDDSLSTNVLPAQAALRAFEDDPVALLVGGHDRGLDYAPLGRSDRGADGADARRHHARQRPAHRGRGA